MNVVVSIPIRQDFSRTLVAPAGAGSRSDPHSAQDRGQFERPMLLYSIGKDSSVLVHLARKAFFPAPIPYPLLHIDTGYEYPEMIGFRDRFAAGIEAQLVVHTQSRSGIHPDEIGTARCCGLLRTNALLDDLREHRANAALGGGRDEGRYAWQDLLSQSPRQIQLAVRFTF